MIKEKLLLCKKKDASDGENMVQSGQREQKKEVFTYDTTGKRKELFERNPVEKLERRHFEAYYCPTATEAIEKGAFPSFRKAAASHGVAP